MSSIHYEPPATIANFMASEKFYNFIVKSVVYMLMLYFLKNWITITFSSDRANCFPRQLRGPALKVSQP